MKFSEKEDKKSESTKEVLNKEQAKDPKETKDVDTLTFEGFYNNNSNY